jgi:hypothetical protein
MSMFADAVDMVNGATRTALRHTRTIGAGKKDGSDLTRQIRIPLREQHANVRGEYFYSIVLQQQWQMRPQQWQVRPGVYQKDVERMLTSKKYQNNFAHPTKSS